MTPRVCLRCIDAVSTLACSVDSVRNPAQVQPGPYHFKSRVEIFDARYYCACDALDVIPIRASVREALLARCLLFIILQRVHLSDREVDRTP